MDSELPGAAEHLAEALEGHIPVAAVKAVSPSDHPRDEPVVEILLAVGWDYLPEPTADIVYNHGFAPVAMRRRTADHWVVVAAPR